MIVETFTENACYELTSVHSSSPLKKGSIRTDPSPLTSLLPTPGVPTYVQDTPKKAKPLSTSYCSSQASVRDSWSIQRLYATDRVPMSRAFPRRYVYCKVSTQRVFSSALGSIRAPTLLSFQELIDRILCESQENSPFYCYAHRYGAPRTVPLPTILRNRCTGFWGLGLTS